MTATTTATAAAKRKMIAAVAKTKKMIAMAAEMKKMVATAAKMKKMSEERALFFFLTICALAFESCRPRQL